MSRGESHIRGRCGYGYCPKAAVKWLPPSGVALATGTCSVYDPNTCSCAEGADEDGFDAVGTPSAVPSSRASLDSLPSSTVQ